MNRSIRTKLLVLALTFILAFGITTPAAAQGPITGDGVPAGTVLERDAILIGQDVAIDGTVNGNVFVFGNQVTVNGEVDGSLILIGQNAGIGGSVTGAVYALALTLDLGSEATVGRDLYVATVSLTSGNHSTIGRDLYAIGLDSGLNGQVERNLHTVIGPIQLYNGLMTLLGFEDLTIKLHFETPQPGSNTRGDLSSSGRPAHFRIVRASADPAFDWGGWALRLLRNWAVLFILGMLLLWLARKPLERAGEPLRARPLQTLGTGLLALVIACAAFVAGLLLAVLIFALGLGLNYLGLWQLAIAFWIIAYACLAVALVILWLLIVYGTKIAIIYLFGTWLFSILFRRKAFWIDALALLAGTAVYALLRAIPYVGWIVGIAVTVAGAGSAWLAWRQWRRKAETATTEKPAKATPRPAVRSAQAKKTKSPGKKK